MRLWHESLLKSLSRQRLLSQHRECCALRGKGWGKKHATVNYVFSHPFEDLVAYHHRVMNEMTMRGYKVDDRWYSIVYRGKNLPLAVNVVDSRMFDKAIIRDIIYPEHDDDYLEECKLLLLIKGDKGK